MTQKKETLSTLFNKIFKLQATDQEKELARKWYDQLSLNQGEIFDTEDEEEKIRQEMQAGLYNHVHNKNQGNDKIRDLYSWIRSAAAILVLGTISVAGYNMLAQNKHNSGSFNIASAHQAIKSFILPDGTKVTLNLASSLTWDGNYNTTERRVTLTGEAFFDVKKDKKHPFIVVTNNIQTKVLGTAFDVESYPLEHQIKVSLLRGKVSISDENNALNTATLVPGQMIDYGRKTGKLAVKAIAIPDIEAWMKGGLTFNDIPLSSAIERLARKYNLQIKYNQQNMDGKTVSASFEAVNWQEALQSILFMHDLNYSTKDNIIYITNN